jgi:hypothetical protein
VADFGWWRPEGKTIGVVGWVVSAQNRHDRPRIRDECRGLSQNLTKPPNSMEHLVARKIIPSGGHRHGSPGFEPRTKGIIGASSFN